MPTDQIELGDNHIVATTHIVQIQPLVHVAIVEPVVQFHTYASERLVSDGLMQIGRSVIRPKNLLAQGTQEDQMSSGPRRRTFRK